MLKLLKWIRFLLFANPSVCVDGVHILISVSYKSVLIQSVFSGCTRLHVQKGMNAFPSLIVFLATSLLALTVPLSLSFYSLSSKSRPLSYTIRLLSPHGLSCTHRAITTWSWSLGIRAAPEWTAIYSHCPY